MIFLLLLNLQGLSKHQIYLGNFFLEKKNKLILYKILNAYIATMH